MLNPNHKYIITSINMFSSSAYAQLNLNEFINNKKVPIDILPAIIESRYTNLISYLSKYFITSLYIVSINITSIITVITNFRNFLDIYELIKYVNLYPKSRYFTISLLNICFAKIMSKLYDKMFPITNKFINFI